jgi:hypothetical protein
MTLKRNENLERKKETSVGRGDPWTSGDVDAIVAGRAIDIGA